MCITIVYFPVCDVRDYEINFIFPIKSFFYMTKMSRLIFKYRENEKHFSYILKGFQLPECVFNPLSANPRKWSNTLKQFVSNLATNCLSVFDHFVILVPKGLIRMSEKYFQSRKGKYMWEGIFFPSRKRNWSRYFGNIFQIMLSQRYVQKLEINRNNSMCIKVDNISKSVNFRVS